MITHLNRRLFLRGLGGAVVAAPFLSSVAERAAKAQSTSGDAPKRLIVMFTHYGCLTNRWFPQTAHGPLSASDFEPTTLKHLAPYASKILLPRGIRAMNEWTSNGARGQGNDPHTQVTGSYFTCQPVTPHESNPFNNGPGKMNGRPIGRSLDHVCAEQISPNGVPLFMRVGGIADNTMSAISYSGPEEQFTGIGNPQQAFSNLTGLFKDDEPMSPDTYRVVRGKSVIDIVKDDLETLERFDMSQSDRQRLEAWKQLLHQTGSGMASAQCNEETATALGLPQGSQANIMAEVGNGWDVADVYANIAVLSAICDANRVIFLKYPGNYTFSGLGHTTESHSLSHRIGNAGMIGTCVPGVLDMLADIDDYYARKFAHLVGQLDSFAEGDGKTVLDNTAAIWFQEMSDGNAHNLNNLPVVQAGSCGGYFKTGQAVNLDDGSPTLSAGNSESVCADGTSNEVNGTTGSTGTPASTANAPINKYFCNLMNALGVKAGPDGYPLAGGTEEVTHFGRWDRTEDFRDGEAGGPPNITNPGGFAALRANA